MNSLINQDNRELKSLWENGNYLQTGFVDCGWLAEPALSSGSSVESYVAEMTRAQLVLDYATVITMAAHCDPDAIVNTWHSSSRSFPKSTTVVWGGYYYSTLKHMVRLWLVQGHPDGEVELGLKSRLSIFNVMCSNCKCCTIWPCQRVTRTGHECTTWPQNHLLSRGNIYIFCCCFSFPLKTGLSFITQFFFFFEILQTGS